MAEKTKETPESLLKFFRDLAETTGIDDDGEDAAVDYASSGVARRGLEAAKMLMTIQQVLGVKPGGAAPAAAKSDAPPASDKKVAELTEMLADSQKEIDRLLMQSMELANQNKGLKDKIQFLQKQVERLYNKNEMAKTLKTIETKKMSAVEAIAMQGEADAAAEEPAAEESGGDEAPAAGPSIPAEPEAVPAAEATPEPAPTAPSERKVATAKFRRVVDRDLQQEFEVEAAARAPKEETDADKNQG